MKNFSPSFIGVNLEIIQFVFIVLRVEAPFVCGHADELMEVPLEGGDGGEAVIKGNTADRFLRGTELEAGIVNTDRVQVIERGEMHRLCENPAEMGLGQGTDLRKLLDIDLLSEVLMNII